MAQRDIKIPFKYCRVDRAARILECEVSDLINLGVENKISLCVNLDGMSSILYLGWNLEKCIEWHDKLKNVSSVLSRAKEITDFSYFSFDNLHVDENDDPSWGPLFEYDEEHDHTLSCKGRAYGLWRILWGLEELHNYRVSYFSGSELAPCMPEIENPVHQLLSFTESSGNDEEDEEWEMSNPGMRVTDRDLWVTAYDVRRLLECKSDYYTLESIYEVSYAAPSSKGKPAIHHSAERHATNRENVLMAAMRFRDENEDLFNNECLKDDGTYNFSAWARHVLNRPFLFPEGDIKIKTEDKVSTIISNAFKPPIQRR